MNHYLLILHGDVEPELDGPFSIVDRDRAAREHRREDPEMSDGLFWLDIEASGKPTIGAFAGGDLDTPSS